MHTLYLPLCGKWSDRTSEPPHPLIYHLVDSAAVAHAIWTSAFGAHSRSRLARALALDIDIAGRLLAFWVGLHDLGKASPTFQALNGTTRTKLADLGYPFPRYANPQPHNFVTCKSLREILNSAPWCLPDALAKNVATSVGAHHGSFPQALEIINLPADEIGDGVWGKARADLAQDLGRVMGVSGIQLSAPEGLAVNHSFFITLAGLTSISDWIASADGHFYPNESMPQNDIPAYWDWSQDRAHDVMTKVLRWKRWKDVPQPTSFGDIFLDLQNKTPFPVQKAIKDIAESLNGPALVIIEAPMGEGKTEAALYIADKWLREPGAEGFYVALPTMATSNSMFNRVKSFLDKRFKSQEVNLHLLHAQASLVEDYEQLKPNVGGRDLNDQDEDVIAAEWFTSKKRGLISPFAVGTVDQALLAVLQVKHVFVRLFGLAHKVVVVDEVHAYDAYMSTLLERLLTWLAALGAPVILLSATLPKKKRYELLRSYGAAVDDGDGGGKIKEASYPRISIARPGKDFDVISIAAAPERKRTVCLKKVTETDAPAVAAALNDALTGGGCAAVICNTVARAQEMYVAVRDRFGRDHCLLLHSRFPYGARLEREDKAKNLFGKPDNRGYSSGRPERFVLVGTQVLEQSLDLDFDLMVTDLAPADLVLQRLGRLHRHKRDRRPNGLEVTALWLLWPDGDADHVPDCGATAYVYDLYVLLRSWLALKNRSEIKVPDEMDEIIEEVYGDQEPMVKSKTWANALKKAREEFDQKIKEFCLSACQKSIPAPYEEDVFGNVRKLLEDEETPKVAHTLQGLTRLTACPNVNVVCLIKKGEIYFVDGDVNETPINFSAAEIKDKAVRKKLLNASIPFSDRRIVWHLLREFREARGSPPGWQKDPYLRNTYPIAFENRKSRVGNYILLLDADRGLVIEKEYETDLAPN